MEFLRQLAMLVIVLGFLAMFYHFIPSYLGDAPERLKKRKLRVAKEFQAMMKEQRFEEALEQLRLNTLSPETKNLENAPFSEKQNPIEWSETAKEFRIKWEIEDKLEEKKYLQAMRNNILEFLKEQVEEGRQSFILSFPPDWEQIVDSEIRQPWVSMKGKRHL